MPDDRKIERAVRLPGGAIFGPGSEEQLDRAIDREQVDYLRSRRAISGDDWTGHGEGTERATAAAEPAGTPGAPRRPDGAGPSAAATATDFRTMTRAQLERELERRNLDADNIQGSGKDGNLLNADLAGALERYETELATANRELAPTEGGAGGGTNEPGTTEGGNQG